jgi:phenylpyruvate tautomerase PptA (4-oxalocrotonate tautomerase family)
MPWVNINLAKTITEEQQDTIKAELAKIFYEVLEKEEQRGFFVIFNHLFGFYRMGERCEDAAALDVKYIGMFALSKKQEVTRRVCQVFSDVLNFDPKKIIIVFTEVMSENWGRREGDYE